MMMDSRARVVRSRLSRLGARLGNWNDRRHEHRLRSPVIYAPMSWRIVNRIVGWLWRPGGTR